MTVVVRSVLVLECWNPDHFVGSSIALLMMQYGTAVVESSLRGSATGYWSRRDSFFILGWRRQRGVDFFRWSLASSASFRRFFKEQIGLSSSGYKNIDGGSYFWVIVFSLTLFYIQMMFNVNIEGLVSVSDLTQLTPETIASRIQGHWRRFRIRVTIHLLRVRGIVGGWSSVRG